MILSNKFLSLAAALTLSLCASAQGGLGGLGGFGGLSNGGLNGSIGGGGTPPTLPSVQSRFGSYDASIGNEWLGGSVHAYAGMVRQKSGTYELGNVSAEFRGTGKFLRRTAEVAEIVGTAANIMNNGVQNRSGSFRIEVLGYSVVNANITSNSTFASSNSTFNLFPGGGISYPIPVGPVTVTLAGNAGCGFSRSANWLLPAATASVGLNAGASAYLFADAHPRLRLGRGHQRPRAADGPECKPHGQRGVGPVRRGHLHAAGDHDPPVCLGPGHLHLDDQPRLVVLAPGHPHAGLIRLQANFLRWARAL